MKSYGQYCPVAQAAEILNQRWTLLVLRDILYGARRFNEIRQFVPLMSPSLLSKRLRELEAAGLVAHDRATAEYRPTDAAEELRAVIELLGAWGQRWVRNRIRIDDLDPNLLMASIHKLIDARHFPAGRSVVAITFTDRPVLRKESWRVDRWWLVVEPAGTELCLKDPGYEVDVFVQTDLRTLTRHFMGDLPTAEALRGKQIRLSGSKPLVERFARWMPRSHFGAVPQPPEPLDIAAVIARAPGRSA